MSKVLEINIDNIEEISNEIESVVRDFVSEYADVEPNETGFTITAEDFSSVVEIDIPLDEEDKILVAIVRSNFYDNDQPEEDFEEVFDTVTSASDFVKGKSTSKAVFSDKYDYDYDF